jgi:hypothetical protein
MTIVGRKGFHRRQGRERKRIEDGKEVVIPGKWSKVYAVVASGADDTYIPVVEEGRGPVPHRLSGVKLEAKPCRMIDLPFQKVSFMRNSPDKEAVTKEGKQYLQKGVPEKHFGRIGADVRQVYIPIVEKSGNKTKIRIDSFMCEEKGDK